MIQDVEQLGDILEICVWTHIDFKTGDDILKLSNVTTMMAIVMEFETSHLPLSTYIYIYIYKYS